MDDDEPLDGMHCGSLTNLIVEGNATTPLVVQILNVRGTVTAAAC